MVQKSTLDFLKTLSKNNNKPWFDEHRNEYLDAKVDFGNFVATLIKKTAQFDSDIRDLQIKDCVFRINRDIRFSKNKTPYKTNMGASFDKGGKKSIYAGYYFHAEPGGKSFAGGGIWMPMAPELKKIRQEIDYNLDEFKRIVEAKSFVTEYKELENSADLKLNNLPRGYDKENPAGEYLKFKSLVAIKYLSDEDITSNKLTVKVVKAFKTLMPLVKFINKAIE
ncbi:MAG: DUF2461 domain-containing protein [Chitinophagaceae bacterium]|nr:DUF2461 domain-containing protein [Chitinophagaceae bacterium]